MARRSRTRDAHYRTNDPRQLGLWAAAMLPIQTAPTEPRSPVTSFGAPSPIKARSKRTKPVPHPAWDPSIPIEEPTS
jgi:hypothetical protein